jgi:hypothetical protein
MVKVTGKRLERKIQINSQEHTKMIKSMDSDNSIGLLEACTRATMKLIKRKGTEK